MSRMKTTQALSILLALAETPVSGMESPNQRAYLFPLIENGRTGYVDLTGSVVLEPQFENSGSFSQGLAPLKVGTLWGYIDRAGEMAIPVQFEEALPFAEGIARVTLAGRQVYIDRRRNFLPFNSN